MIHFSIKVVYPCKSIQIDGLGASCGSKLALGALHFSIFAISSHWIEGEVCFCWGSLWFLIACDSRSLEVDSVM